MRQYSLSGQQWQMNKDKYYNFQIKMEKILLVAIAEILKIILVKEDYVSRKGWLHKINYGFAIVSLIYLTITNSVVNAHNIIFVYLQTIDSYLDQYSALSFTLAWVLLALSANVIVPGLILVQMRHRQQKNEIYLKTQLNLKTYTAISLIIFETFMAPLFVFLISYLSVTNWLLYICDILLAIGITLAFRLNNLYKEFFFAVILSVNILSTQLFPICVVLASLFAMSRRENQSVLFYLQAVAFGVIVFLNANFHVDITIFHLIVATVSIAVIGFFMPKQYTQICSDFNQFLLRTVHKISEGQTLSKAQERKIYAILHFVLIQQVKYGLDIQKGKHQDIFEQINKDNISSLLRNKIRLDKAANPNNLLYDIQLSQGQIYTNCFSISLLTKIQTVNRAVQQKGDLTLRLRMMKLINKLEQQYMGKDEKISPTIIIHIQKSIEMFYHKIDQVLALYSSIWKETTRKCFQKILIKKISKLCNSQSQCVQILKTINQYKDARLQNLVFNYIQKRFSLSDVDDVCTVKPSKFLQFESTKFLLVYNQQIVDVSQQFAYQIQTKPSYLISATIFTIIPRQFHEYFKAHIDNWLNNDTKDHEMILPFKSAHNECVFVPYVCSFKVFAQIEGGIKYLIHVQKGYQTKIQYFMMYSLAHDQIIMLSKSFCQEYKSIQQLNKQDQFSFSAEELLGIDLTFLSNRTKQDPSQQILCQINLKRFQRKTALKKISRHHFFNLKLAQIYEVENDRIFLLSITPKHQSTRSRTINEFIINENLKLNAYAHKSQDKMSQNQTLCLIKNPLKQLIQERINKKNHVVYNSYLVRSAFICIIILMAAIVGYMQFKITVNGAVGGISDKISRHVRQMSKYETIYLLFYHYYIYIHSLKHPQHFLQVSPNINITKLQKGYATKVTKAVNTLLSMSVDPNVQLRSNQLKLDYVTYQLASQTDVMTLLPLLQDIKYSISSNQFIFTLQNSQVVDLYINSLVPIDTNIVKSTLTQQFNILIITFVLITFIVFILKIQYLKIRYIIWELLDIYDKLSEDQIIEQIQSLKKFRLLLNGNKNKIQQILYHPNINDTKNIGKQSHFVLIVNNNILLLLIIAALALLYGYCYWQLNSYSRDVEAVANYASSLQLISKTNTYTSERYYQAAVQELLPINRRLSIQRIYQLIFPTLDQSHLPIFFNPYIEKSATIMKINICNSSDLLSKINSDLLLGTMNCSKVIFSQLSKGFFEAFPFVLGEINKHIGVLMSTLNSKYDSQSIYPFFAQLIYSRKAIDLIIDMLNGQFKQFVSAFLTQRAKTFDFILLLAFLSLLATTVSICIYMWHICNLCKIAKKCFNLLPRKFIYSIKASKALIRQGLLSKIQMVTI